MRDFSELKFLEIGAPWLKQVLPAQTVCYSPVDNARTADPENGLHAITLRTLPSLWRALHDPAFALIACRPMFYAPWHWQWISRSLFSRNTLRGESRLFKPLGGQLLRWPVRAPIAVIDTEDYPGINPDRDFLLSRCRLYFKRELPPDRWRLFTGRSATGNLPSGRFRKQARYSDYIAKIRPLPLGLPQHGMGLLPVEASEKTTDVFYAGDIDFTSTVRSFGMTEIAALRERGIAIDVPQSRLSLAEYYRRAAQAWLIWSPEGLGWDCFRHYEALACGSVPVISMPTIERHRPLIEGTHAFYYSPSPGELTATILAALGNKDRLRSMASAGKAHVMANFTPSAVARYVVESTLDSTEISPTS